MKSSTKPHLWTSMHKGETIWSVALFQCSIHASCLLQTGYIAAVWHWHLQPLRINIRFILQVEVLFWYCNTCHTISIKLKIGSNYEHYFCPQALPSANMKGCKSISTWVSLGVRFHTRQRVKMFPFLSTLCKWLYSWAVLLSVCYLLYFLITNKPQWLDLGWVKFIVLSFPLWK